MRTLLWSEALGALHCSLSFLQRQGPLPDSSEPGIDQAAQELLSEDHHRALWEGLTAEPAVGPHLTFGTISPEQWTLPNPWPPLNSVTQRRGQSLSPFLWLSSAPLVALATVTAGPWPPKAQTVMRSQAGLFCSAGFEDKRGVLGSSSSFKTFPQGLPLPKQWEGIGSEKKGEEGATEEFS